MANLVLLAPINGWVSPLSEVPDPVFADRILGDGVAIDPTGSTLHAPCDGVVASLARHAVTVRAAGGAEILVHVGLETVAVGGRGFTSRVREGDKVKAGDPLLDFDLEFLGARVKSLISPVIVANGDAFRVARRSEGREIAVGEFLMELEPLAEARSESAVEGALLRNVVVKAAHGIHARPAALISQCAKRFGGEIVLSARGRDANGRSAVALMALGAGCGDEVTLKVSGPDAQQAANALQRLIETPSEEAPVMAAAVPRPISREDSADIIRGIGAAPGIARGKVVQLRAADLSVVEEGSGLSHEVGELDRALKAVKQQLERAASSGERVQRDIVTAHIALIEDSELHHAALRSIEQGKSAGFAWRQAVRASVAVLRALRDERLRERAGDLLDLERQVLAVLAGETAKVELPPSSIVAAEEILPSDLIGLNASKLAGLVMAQGGPTSHVAILAAGMNIPALVGAGSAVLAIEEGTEVLLDANEGLLRVKPDARAIAAAEKLAAAATARLSEERSRAMETCRTADGFRIEVFANLGKGAEEASAAVRQGAEGCGLLRTEFLFMDRDRPPSEEEQYAQYQAIADALAGRSFILRTFDIGGDKPVPYLAFPPEENPALGLRGVRTALAWPDLLRAQLVAAARVVPSGSCWIMLPMIVSLGEFARVRTILDELCRERGLTRPPLGVMIETPSSALIADQLAREADFLSIGTNDLSQYVLAIDRGHRSLAVELDALHPAVLRLIARTAEAARAAGKPVGVCGGLAADSVAVPLLLGLGVGELSVPPPVIPRLKAAIRDLVMENCRAAATEALTMDSAAAVRTLLRSRFA